MYVPYILNSAFILHVMPKSGNIIVKKKPIKKLGDLFLILAFNEFVDFSKFLGIY